MKLLSNLNKFVLAVFILTISNSYCFAENLLISSAHQNSLYNSKSYYEGLKTFGIGDSIYIVLDELSENNNLIQNYVNNGETVNAQVVQLLSNGNLLIQGKKTVINNNKRINLVITGIANPKSITKSGQILSKNITNINISYLNNSTINHHSSFKNKLIKHLL